MSTHVHIDAGSATSATLPHHEHRLRESALPTSATWIPRYRATAAALDALAALVAIAAAIVADQVWEISPSSPRAMALTLALGPALWIACLAQAGAYDPRLLGVGSEEYGAVPRAAVRLLAVSAVVAAVTHGALPATSPLLVLVGAPVAVLTSLVLRYGLRQRLHASRTRHGAAMQRTVVIGDHEAVVDLVHDLHSDPSRGLLPVGTCTSTPEVPLRGLPHSGALGDPLTVVDREDADVVVVAHPSGLTPPELRRLSWALEERGVELMVSPGIMEVAGPRLSFRPSASLSLVHVEAPAVRGGALAGKIVFDRVFAAVLLTVLAPALLAIAVAVKVDSRGSVLFRQKRVGARGEPFEMIKFRSMTADAEARLAAVRQQGDDGSGPLFKLRKDPRVTSVGRLLRRYSLDELPQLWNVMRGDMSLVGPRPPLQSEVATYEADAIRRLRVRPGLTGLWQVSGRSNLSWDESLRLDLRYVDNWSMMLDLQILWRTARAVLKAEGAY